MKRPILDRSTPLVYAITDRQLLRQHSTGPDLTYLIEFANRAVSAGVDMVQIRERDLPVRETLLIAETLANTCRGMRTRVLVNDRVDVAQSASVGVHLTTRSLTVEVVRAVFGERLFIGASTHTLGEALSAQRSGADFIVFGPVFETPSKREYGRPVGLEALHQVTTELTIPVLAIGGIKLSNFRDALSAGAAGIAAISLFIEAQDLAATVATLKRHVAI